MPTQPCRSHLGVTIAAATVTGMVTVAGASAGVGSNHIMMGPRQGQEDPVRASYLIGHGMLSGAALLGGLGMQRLDSVLVNP